jgi:trehalose utilization protein
MTNRIRVTVWNENKHERTNPVVQAVYPQGIHGAIAGFLSKCPDLVVRTATQDQPSHGLSDEVLQQTDVLTWWGHLLHEAVEDAVVDKVRRRVLMGMGLIVLHSGHYSKIFRRLMGTGCTLKWREAGEREVLWVTSPGHPIVQGLGECLVLEHTEMYGEYFDVPAPEDVVFISNFAGGEVFRSGLTYRRGAGKVFYFRPGHETFPIYHDPGVQKVIANAVRWAAPTGTMKLEMPCKEMGWFEQAPPTSR